MAKHAIEKGSHDSWTITGKTIAAATEALNGGAVAGGRAGGRPWSCRPWRGAAGAAAAANQPGGAGGDPVAPFGRGASVEAQMHAYNDVLHAPDKRDPRGYIIPADQPDFLTAVKFVNTLRHVGVYVDQATAPFTVAGKSYPTGSFVMRNEPGGARAGARHDGAAGSPERLRISGRSAAPSVRQRRLDARLRDGRASSTACSMRSTRRTRRIQGTELAKPMAGTIANAIGRRRLSSCRTS